MSSYRLDSPFFYESERFTMYITEAVWLDKDEGSVEIDLINNKAGILPEGVTFDKSGNEYYSNSLMVDSADYFDEALGEYVEKPGIYLERMTLDGFGSDTVFLMPAFSRVVELSEPAVVVIK